MFKKESRVPFFIKNLLIDSKKSNIIEVENRRKVNVKEK